MATDEETGRLARTVTDDLEVDEFVPYVEATHQDQYVHHTHELPETSAEIVWRILVRVVPLAYGALFGALMEQMQAGVALGLLVSMIADLTMRENSLLLASVSRIHTKGCPAIATAAHGLAAIMGYLGLAMPRALSEMQCKAQRP